ncbi:MAG: hypothetical protein AAFO06_14015 [Cyanobacteria bacterium J06597_16]
MPFGIMPNNRSQSKKRTTQSKGIRPQRVSLIIISTCLLLPAIALAVYKPTRILVPGLFSGLHCWRDRICTDDLPRLSEAQNLTDEATHFVETHIQTLKNKPTVVFCSEESCFNHFGFENASAHTIGVSGIVVGPKGWSPYIVRHELIHHIQAEQFGIIDYLRYPRWFIEGMAYTLSEDPRPTLWEQNQRYRECFKAWVIALEDTDQWIAAKDLSKIKQFGLDNSCSRDPS